MATHISRPDHLRRPRDPHQRPRRPSAATAEPRMGRAAPQRRRNRRTRVASDRQRSRRASASRLNSCPAARSLPSEIKPSDTLERAHLTTVQPQAIERDNRHCVARRRKRRGNPWFAGGCCVGLRRAWLSPDLETPAGGAAILRRNRTCSSRRRLKPGADGIRTRSRCRRSARQLRAAENTNAIARATRCG